MTIIVEQFARKPFYVDAIQVTAENMQEVADWCKGHIKLVLTPRGTKEKYIKVDVIRPTKERQAMAFTEDWVLSSPQGFKVYTNDAFLASFRPCDGEDLRSAVEAWESTQRSQIAKAMVEAVAKPKPPS